MLAEMVDHVVGIDPDRDWITAAVLEAGTAGVVAFPANAVGYRDVVAWADEYSIDTERAWAIEGTASYGRGLTAALGRCGEWVIEFDRAKEKPAKDGFQDRRARRHLCRTRNVRASQAGVAACLPRAP